jgi:hypothetical protein
VKKAISIFLASIILFSSVGFAINTHFCEGRAVDTSISMGVELLDCGMPMPDNENDGNGEQLDKQPCCQNHHQIVEVDQNQNNPFPAFELNQTFFVAFAHTFLVNESVTQKVQANYLTSPPPLVKQDMLILYQSFLI